MPPAQCAKCRGAPAAEGDSWCVACSGWEALGRELTAHWDSAGARLIAGDLVVNTTRQVRALRSLAAGLSRELAGAPRASLVRPVRAERDAATTSRRSSHAGRSPSPHPGAKEEEETGPEEEDEEESEDRTPSPPRRSSGGGKRPPEPPCPPGVKALPPRGRGHSGESKSRGHTRSDRSRSQGRRGHHRRIRRAGRKHKRLNRLATNPTLVIHRAPGDSFFDLSSLKERPLELASLGK